ncbi:MAG: molybdopterin-dependent oxidoreductase [Candidatus Micrarchaeaceae archaeon]
MKNGAIVCSEPATDLVNIGVAREDLSISQTDLLKNHVQSRPHTQNMLSNKFLNTPDRILYPMIRTGARGDPNGAFVRTTWDNALSIVATNIQNTITKYGPNSIFPTNTVVPYMSAGITGWGNVSYGAEDFAALYMMGLSSGSSGEKAPSIFASKLIVLWGQDPTHSLRNATYYMKLAHEQGVPVIAIDVKYTIKDDVLADQFIPIKPGTDAAMMVAVAYVLFNENLYNKTYVTANVEPTGFQNFQNYVMGTAAGPDGLTVPRTPAWAAPICGVPAATIQAFAELYAKSTPAFLFFGPGAAREYHGENPARLAVMLQTMMGSVGVLGGSVTFDTILPFSTAFDRPTPPSANYGITAATYTPPTLLLSYRFAQAVNMYPQYAAGTITAKQYANAIGNVPGNPVPNIRMMCFTGANTINQRANIPATIQAVKNVDFVVSQCQHWNLTAKVADVVLPIAEHYEYTEGFISLNDGPVVFAQKLVEPQGQAVNPSWIYAELAVRLGIISKYWPTYQSGTDFETQVLAAYQTGWNTWMTTAAATTAFPSGVPTWSQFLQNPIMKIDNSVPAIVPFTAQIAGTTKWATTSGKIEFYSTYLATTDLTTTKWAAPIFPMGAYQDILHGYNDPSLSTYPLNQLDTHNRHRTHSFQDSNPWIKGEVYRHGLWMSVFDAKARGLKDNDTIMVTSSAGSTVLPVYVSQRIIPGWVNIYDGAWANINSAGLDTAGSANTVGTNDLNPNGEDAHIEVVQVTKYTGGS